MERWLPVPGYEGIYEVSSHGRVNRLVARGNWKAAIQRPTLRGDGYYITRLRTADGKSRGWLMHRLVLTAFVGPAPSSVHGAHLDGDKSNNTLENLVWCTPRENEAHKAAHGRTTEGERNGNAKLTHDQVEEIRRDYVPYSHERCCAALGRRYGVTYQTVWDVVTRRHWNHPAAPTHGENACFT